MEEGKSLKDELKDIKQMLESTEKKKKEKKPRAFRFPGKGKLGTARLKKNWVTVIQISENRNLNFTKLQIQDQTVMIDGIPRLATADNILLYKNKPVLLLPMWSVKPISPSDDQFLNITENWKTLEEKGLNVKGYKVLMDRMKREAISAKKSMPWWIWIVGLAVVGIAIYVLTSK